LQETGEAPSEVVENGAEAETLEPETCACSEQVEATHGKSFAEHCQQDCLCFCCSCELNYQANALNLIACQG
jgi:hypothetical protein